MNLLAFIHVVYLIFASANLNYELNISSHDVPVIADKNTNALPPDFIFSTRSANMIYHLFIRHFGRLRQRLSAKIIIESLKVTLVSFAILLLVPRVFHAISSHEISRMEFFFSHRERCKKSREYFNFGQRPRFIAASAAINYLSIRAAIALL